MNRKKFFSAVGISFIGVALSQAIPFKMLFNKNSKLENQKIKVQINPLAVQRKKQDRKNG